jgi:presenilin-like A22 family membrane protease
MTDTPISLAASTAFAGALLFPVALPGSMAALNVSGQAIVNAVLAAITPALIGSLNLGLLPNADPGGGKPWLNTGGGAIGTGVIQVGS